MTSHSLFVRTSLIFGCLFNPTFANTTTIIIPNVDEFEAKCNDFLLVEGITNATEREKRLVRRIIYEQELGKRNRETGVKKDKLTKSESRNVTSVVRSQIKYLEDELFPKTLVNPESRYARWTIILDTPGNDREKMRKLVVSEFEKSFPNLNDSAIVDMVSRAVQNISEDITSPGTIASPRSLVDPATFGKINKLMTKAIEVKVEGDVIAAQRYFGTLGLNYEAQCLGAVRAVSTQLDSIGICQFRKENKTLDPRKFFCIVITPVYGKFKTSVSKNDVKKFFPTRKPLLVKFETEAKPLNEPSVQSKDRNAARNTQLELTEKIIVLFRNLNSALDAYNNHQNWLKKDKVRLSLTACPVKESTMKSSR